MDKRRRARYRRLLEEKRQELETLLARAGEAVRGTDLASPDDSAQRAADSYAKEFAFSQSDAERLQLIRVKAALLRSDSKDFGLCESCGESIDTKRLEAVPWTPYCHRCQEQEELGNEPTSDAE